MFMDFSLVIPFNSVHIIESIAKFMKSIDFIENLGHTRKFVSNYRGLPRIMQVTLQNVDQSKKNKNTPKNVSINLKLKHLIEKRQI